MGDGWIGKDWGMGGIWAHDVKFPGNQLKKKKRNEDGTINFFIKIPLI